MMAPGSPNPWGMGSRKGTRTVLSSVLCFEVMVENYLILEARFNVPVTYGKI